jgi:predicted metalloprotease with PDZ domain
MPLLPALALVLLRPFAAAGDGIEYRLAFEPGAEQWSVEARIEGRGEERIEYRLPRWTPGAYHPADFGRFARAFEAVDQAGNAFVVERMDDGHVVVLGTEAAEEIVLRYRGDSISTSTFSNGVIDVEANRIAADHAYLNPPSLLGFVPGRLDEPVRLWVTLPTGWSAGTVLEQDEAGAYRAPSYYRFEDSPLLFGPELRTEEFVVEGTSHAVTVHGRGAEDVRAIAAGCERLVRAGARLMGGLPYPRYRFLFAFTDRATASGLEHSDSTLILLAKHMGIGEDARDFWGLTAHEYFHLWCAERIHVAGLHRPDFTVPITTGTLWVNEGITEYFCRHLQFHAGFLDEEQLLESALALHLPAEALGGRSWVDVSRGTASWSGMQDVAVFALHMYHVGPRTILALDLTMRRATAGARGVHDLLRYFLDHHVREDRGFAEDELDDALAAVAGAEAAEFHLRCIEGTEVADPSELLDVLGYAFEDGRLIEVDGPSEDQLRARRDFFSITGDP